MGRGTFTLGSIKVKLLPIPSLERLSEISANSSPMELAYRLRRCFACSVIGLSIASFFTLYFVLQCDAVYSVLTSVLLPYIVSSLLVSGYVYFKNKEIYVGLKREYPLFVLMFSILHEATLYSALAEMYKSLGQLIKNTKWYICRWLSEYHITQSSLEETIFSSLEKMPPNSFRNFLINYLRINALGGDVREFIRRSIDDVVEGFRINWEDTWKNAASKIETVILLFNLAPSILLTSVSFVGYKLLSDIMLFLMLLTPFLGYVFYVYLDSSLEKFPLRRRVAIDKRWLMLSIATSIVITYVASRLIKFDLPTMLTFFLSVALFYPSLSTLASWQRDRRLESELTSVLMQLEELLRHGFSILEALQRLELTGYSPSTKAVIHHVKYYIEHRDETILRKLESYPPLVNLSLRLLVEIAKIGGGLREVIYVRELVNEYVKMNLRRIKYATIPILTAMAMTFLSVYIFHVIVSMLTSNAIVPQILLPPLEGIGQLIPYYKALSVISTLTIGLLIAKICHDEVTCVYPAELILATLLFSFLLYL